MADRVRLLAAEDMPVNEEREAYERFMRKEHVGRRRAATALGSGALRPADLDVVRLLNVTPSAEQPDVFFIDNQAVRSLLRSALSR